MDVYKSDGEIRLIIAYKGHLCLRTEPIGMSNLYRQPILLLKLSLNRARVLDGRDYSPSTAAHICIQILQCINDAFRCNIVSSSSIHPRNFYMGRLDNMHIIYIIGCSMGFIQANPKHRALCGDV